MTSLKCQIKIILRHAHLHILFFICVKFDQKSSSGLGGVALTIYDWHRQNGLLSPPPSQNPQRQPLFVELNNKQVNFELHFIIFTLFPSWIYIYLSTDKQRLLRILGNRKSPPVKLTIINNHIHINTRC